MKPTPDALARLEHFRQDDEYLQSHYQELWEQYPEQWVAIYGKRLVGVGSDYERLLEDLEKRGLPLGQVLTRFLTNEEQYWSLEDFEVLDEFRKEVEDGR